MAKAYELTDAQWKKIEHVLPGKKRDLGRTAQDNRMFLILSCGCCEMEHSGAIWWNVTATGKVSTSVLIAGQNLVFGKGFLKS